MDRSSPYAAALSTLPSMGPAMLVGLLRRWEPREAWTKVREGVIERPRPRGRRALVAPPLPGWEAPDDRAVAQPDVGVPSWADLARGLEPERWWAAVRARGIQVTWWGRARLPGGSGR